MASAAPRARCPPAAPPRLQFIDLGRFTFHVSACTAGFRLGLDASPQLALPGSDLMLNQVP